MGLLDGLVGGAIGAELVTVVNGFLEKQGGMQGLVSKFEQQGLGDTVKSWIGSGSNLPVTADQIHKVLGAEGITHFAEKLGIPTTQVADKLAQFLPQTVDTLTPEGTLPPAKG